MANTEPYYQPLIHFSTDIQIGATDALVTMGKMLSRANADADRDLYLARIEEHVTRMMQSIANYRRAVDAGRGLLTVTEYRNPVPVVPFDGEAA